MIDAPLRFDDRQSGFALILDQDERVCYAYLLHADGKVCGDLWLWNVVSAPEEPEWRDRSKAPPFLNPRRLVREDIALPLFTDASQATAVWFSEDGRIGVEISLNGQLVGRLREGEKPGAALMASADGPCAKRLAV